jgi:hypothetical protein
MKSKIMAVTNEDIMKRLDKIEKLLRTVEKEEVRQLRYESTIKMEEGQLKTILNKKVNVQFDNITDWKRYIWDNCELRKSHSQDKKIDFYCMKTGNLCRFMDCFRNRV